CLETHAIHRFRGGTLGHGSGVSGAFPVGTEHECRVEQVFIDSFQRVSSEPTFTVDVQRGPGWITHHTSPRLLPSLSPASLRHGAGFPNRGLRRRLRRHGALSLSALPRFVHA